MSERETKVVTLPSGKQATVKAWLTAREVLALRESVMGSVKVGMSTDVGPGGSIVKKPVLGDMDLSNASGLEKVLIETVLVAYDGSTETIFERILDGRIEDYMAVINAANEAAGFVNPTTGK